MNPKRKPLDRLVRGSGGPFRVNQHAPVFNDRRTARERSRTSQRKAAINRSRDYE